MKEIKDYLHLYLGCEISATGFIPFKLTPKMLSEWDEHYRNFQLILRPLSDMSDEEMLDYCKLDFGCKVDECEPQDYKIKNNQIWYLDNTWDSGDGWSEMRDKYASLDYPNCNQFIYLLKQGFDLFGLIESGLAIDKTKM